MTIFVAVGASAGGVGNSSIVSKLAWGFQQRGRKTLVVDTDTSHGLTRLLGASDLLKDLYNSEKKLRPYFLLKNDDGICLLGAYKSSDAIDINWRATISYILNKNKESIDICFIDVGRFDLVDDKTLFSIADLLICCSNLGYGSSEKIDNSIRIVQNNISPSAKTKILLNRFDPRRKSHREELILIRERFQNLLMDEVVHEDDFLSLSQRMLSSVLDVHPYAQSSRDITGVINALNDMFYAETASQEVILA